MSHPLDAQFRAADLRWHNALVTDADWSARAEIAQTIAGLYEQAGKAEPNVFGIAWNAFEESCRAWQEQADKARTFVTPATAIAREQSAPERRVWENAAGERWMDHPSAPDTLVLLHTAHGPTPHVVVRSRTAVETHGGPLTEVTTREETDRTREAGTR